MYWRLAKSLTTLHKQVNAAYPKRSKASDGTIGDAAHRKSASDHNPNAAGVVCALDLTHDPKHGFDAHKMAETIRKSPHSNAKYIISNGRITGDFNGWKWQKYTGSNPHSKHVHISVGNGYDGQSKPAYDSTASWNIKAPAKKPAKSNAAIAKEVLAGKWGNGPVREARLKNAGYSYSAVQAEVKKLLAAKKKPAAKPKSKAPAKPAPKKKPLPKPALVETKTISIVNAPVTPALPPQPNFDQENNTLLKQILAVVTWVKDHLAKIFK